MKLFGSLTELVSLVYRKDSQTVTLRPNQTTTYTAARDIQTPQQDAASILVSRDSTDTLTNKSMSGSSNTFTNLPTSGLTGTVAPANGGTGVANNSASTITITGSFPIAATLTASTAVTFPTSGTLSTLAGSETLTNKTLGNTNTVTLKDTLFTLQDDGDATKQGRFQLSGITTGNTRTYTLPDADGTLITSATAAFSDSQFTLQDNGDATKQLKFEVSGITTGTTRTLTAPNTSDTIAVLGTAQTLQNKTLDNSNTVTLTDSAFTLQDNGDTSKQLKLELSGITTATTRTLTVPNASDTIAVLGTAQTFSALKTFSAGLAFGGSTLSTFAEGSFTITSATVTGNFNAGSGLTVATLRYRQIGNIVFCSIQNVSGSVAFNINASNAATTFTLTGATGLPSFASKISMGGSCRWNIGSTTVPAVVVADSLGGTGIAMQAGTTATGNWTADSIIFWYAL